MSLLPTGTISPVPFPPGLPTPGSSSRPRRPPPSDERELSDRTTQVLVLALDADPEERRRLYEEVVTSHLWLAESVSRRFRYRGEDPEDLLQVARIGLIEACERFRPDRGPFLAFAVPTITGVLKRHFRDHGWTVRPPRRTQELAAEMWQQWPALAQRLGKVPSERELATQLGEPVMSVAGARYANQGYHATSLDAVSTHGTQFATDETSRDIDRVEIRLVLAEVVAQLDDSERVLLRLRFAELMSQAEIAVEIGTSQMQVSRLLTRLMVKLRRLVEGSEDLLRAS